MWRYAMLGFIPVALLLEWLAAPALLVFVCSALAIVPLASMMEEATEQLAGYLGPTLGGLLNATLGNLPEMIIATFALSKGLEEIVKASLVGSILGSLLFGLGMAMFAGGLKYPAQRFSTASAGLSSSLLFLAAVGLLVPSLFVFSAPTSTKTLSLEIAVVLFVVYLGSLAYSLITHRQVFASKHEGAGEGAAAEPGEHPRWSLGKALGVLAGITLVLAYMSEVLTDAIEPMTKTLGLTPAFAGIFLLGTVGNLAQLLNAYQFARKDRMELVFGITVGSSTQLALLVAPFLVFASQFMTYDGAPLDLHFQPLEVFAIVIAVFAGKSIWTDGESSWIEGLMLLGLYAILGIGFFYLPA